MTGAQVEYQFGPGKGNRYTNEFSYDTIGNFTRKYQQHKIIQPLAAEHLPKETNYLLNYQYTGPHPHAVTDTGDKLYSYDAGGNMTGWDDKTSGKRRTILWNEENRVKEIQDNGKNTYFLYDDQGERVLKSGRHGETFYINRFYSIKNGELGTKSIYAGNTRIVSKLVKTPNTTTANTQTSTTPGIQGLNNGQGKKLGIIRRLSGGTSNTTTVIAPPEEKDQFFYHGDHLGSSNMITDAKGAIYQHLEYFPYGETWIEEGGSFGGNTPGYKFTGKELDPETGLYYFGARYYEPVISRWISADPILGKYLPNQLDKKQLEKDWKPEKDLPGMGGVYNPANLALHGYGHSNPIKFIDPDGQSPVGWIIKIFKGGGEKIIGKVESKAEAVLVRKQGGNVVAKTEQTAAAIERANAGGKPIMKHKGHELPDGTVGRPHYQTEGEMGHTFWAAGALAILGSLLDPFDSISGELSNEGDQKIQQINHPSTNIVQQRTVNKEGLEGSKDVKEKTNKDQDN